MGSVARRAVLVFTVATALLFTAACGKKSTDGSQEAQGGEIEAVNLIAAWVDAGAKEKDPFTFTAKDSKEYQATFEKDVLPLFTTANIWAANTASCTSCHTGVTENSAHEMGLGSYADIMTGGDSLSGEAEPIIEPGKWSESSLRKRLRNNRMPPSMPFLMDESNRDGPVVKSKSGGEIEAVKLIGAWVDAGAKDGSFTFTGADGKSYKGTFKDDVLRLFTEANVWAANTASCTSCHTGVTENSAHEMGLGSYADIMTGGDSLSGEPEPIIEPGKWSESSLRARLRNNRMPPSMPFLMDESNRDGPIVKAGTPTGN